MAVQQVDERLRDALYDLEKEAIIATGIGDLTRLVSDISNSPSTSYDSYEEGITLIGNLATDNAKRITELHALIWGLIYHADSKDE